jgi:hypothetical protein
MTIERIARLETKLDHVSRMVDELRTTQLGIVASMNEARGAARAARVIGHAVTALIAFAVSQFGAYLHLPPR